MTGFFGVLNDAATDERVSTCPSGRGENMLKMIRAKMPDELGKRGKSVVSLTFKFRLSTDKTLVG